MSEAGIDPGSVANPELVAVTESGEAEPASPPPARLREKVFMPHHADMKTNPAMMTKLSFVTSFS